MDWIKLDKYCDLTGDTAQAVHNRLNSGIWLRDVHARVPEGSRQLWVNTAAANDWAAGGRPAHQHGAKSAQASRR